MRLIKSVRHLFFFLAFIIGGGIFLYDSSLPSELYYQLLQNQNTTRTVGETMVAYRKERNSTGEMKYILYWALQANAIRRLGGNGSEPFAHCPINQCTLTKNRTLMPVEDYPALMFNLRDIVFKDYPEKRNAFQRYIMWTIESPAYPYLDKTNIKELGGVFNWTFTFRTDSDIIGPYGWLEPLAPLSDEIYTREFRRKQVSLDGTNYASNRTKLVAWVVSHCGATNKRDKYAEKLKKYVEVDIYGGCTKKKCQNCDETLTNYKFYLAFENSNCLDYITEKFYRTFKLGAIPIVYGGADYSKAAPPHSYIDIRNYKTARELAEYLKLLDANDDLYNEYFWWRKLYKGYYDIKDTRQALCGLCAKLHLDKEPKTYDNLEQFWKIGGNCTKPENSSFPVWKE